MTGEYNPPMQLFALETDADKLCQSVLSPGECVVQCVRFHWFRFAAKVCMYAAVTVVLVALAVAATALKLPPVWVAGITFLLWFFFVFFRLLAAFIDWRFDILLVTPEKIVMIDQRSIFHRKVQQMNLENLASVHAETQFLNLFPFGKICFDLKEGLGRAVCLSYIPDAERVGAAIGNVLTQFQRRQAAAQ